jgi:hypothetical protein
VAHLKRLLVLAQARHLEKGQQNKPTKLADVSILPFAVYKPYLVFFGLVDGLYKICFKVGHFNWFWCETSLLTMAILRRWFAAARNSGRRRSPTSSATTTKRSPSPATNS